MLFVEDWLQMRRVWLYTFPEIEDKITADSCKVQKITTSHSTAIDAILHGGVSNLDITTVALHKDF